jgi:type VI secretion system secreted protein Hcp
MAKTTRQPLAVTQLEDRLVPAWFMKFDGVPGETPASKQHDQIEIESWSFGLPPNPKTPIGHDIVITRTPDAASPDLFKKCVTGQHIPKVHLEFFKADNDRIPMLDFTLKNVIISDYNMSSGGDRPTESFHIDFTKFKLKYHKQMDDSVSGPNGKPSCDSSFGPNGQLGPDWAGILESSLDMGRRARHRLVEELIASPACTEALANSAHDLVPSPVC